MAQIMAECQWNRNGEAKVRANWRALSNKLIRRVSWQTMRVCQFHAHTNAHMCWQLHPTTHAHTFAFWLRRTHSHSLWVNFYEKYANKFHFCSCPKLCNKRPPNVTFATLFWVIVAHLSRANKRDERTQRNETVRRHRRVKVKCCHKMLQPQQNTPLVPQQRQHNCAYVWVFLRKYLCAECVCVP